MDPVTQAALGAAVGQLVGGRVLGPRAALAGAFAGAVPDIDVVFSTGGDWFDSLRLHRGITHSVFFGPAVGPLIGLLAWDLERRRWRHGAGTGSRERALAWVLVMSLGLLSHPLLDVLTSYGTQLLQPFSDARFAIHAMPIIDPVYTLLLLGGVGLGIYRSRARIANGITTIAAITLLVSSAYLGWAAALNARAEAWARADLAAENIAHDQLSAFPTLLQIHYRRVVARSDSADHVGYVSLWKPCDIRWQSAPRQTPPNASVFLESREGRIFNWFAMGWLRFAPVGSDPSIALRAVDLRYGLDSDPDRSLFNVELFQHPTTGHLGRARPGRGIGLERTSTLTALLASAYPDTCPIG
ncbi:MAG: metal-dependent hydrolase [Pseudomonadales bacterium]